MPPKEYRIFIAKVFPHQANSLYTTHTVIVHRRLTHWLDMFGKRIYSMSAGIITSSTNCSAGGVIHGSDAKLPYNGIEAFGFTNVVRRIMFKNATEDHELIVNVKL